MRIVVTNYYGCALGGIETYLAWLISELARTGHELAMLSEVDVIPGHTTIPLPSGAPRWCVKELGAADTLAKLREWRPKVILVNGEIEESLEAEILSVAPAVYFAHGFTGTCISGVRAHQFPSPEQCNHTLGLGCLLRYYPRRCGGLNPITMLSQYGANRRRRLGLHSYSAIVTASEFVRAVYVRAGVSADLVRAVPLELVAPPFEQMVGSRRAPGRNRAIRLLFSGRMMPTKGGQVLIEAAARVTVALGRPINVTFAGDGPERGAWERQAARVSEKCAGLTFCFAGWCSADEVRRLYLESDLLAVPSLWPEPFGLVGPEAGLHGLPQAAFAVGGIPEWLIDGENGYLASANPATAVALADAIIKCLAHPTEYERLSNGAIAVARRFTNNGHARKLIEVLSEAAGA